MFGMAVEQEWEWLATVLRQSLTYPPEVTSFPPQAPQALPDGLQGARRRTARITYDPPPPPHLYQSRASRQSIAG